MKSPTPRFFQILRNTALAVGALATGFATAGIAVPVMVALASVAGGVATASQLVTKTDESE